MLGMHTQSDVPVLNAKAAKTLQTMRWLTSVVLAQAQNGDARQQVRATALWGFTRVFDLLQHQGQWLTTEAAKQLDIARQAALQGYNCFVHCSL